MNSSEINQWLYVVEPFRKRLDLASIIWFWMRLENTPNWESIYKEIESVCGDVIDNSVLEYLSKTPQSDFGGAFAHSNHEQKADEHETAAHWIEGYRDRISVVTPFADREYYSDEDIVLLGDELCPSEHYLHPVLSNEELTNRFLDLDLMLDRLEHENLFFPLQFRQPELLLSEIEDSEKTISFPKKDDDPFKAYRLIPKAHEFLWSGKSEAGNALLKLAGNVASPEFKHLLGAVLNVSPAQANSLRIFTQPMLERYQGTKGADLSKILKPLMKVMFADEELATVFWGLKKKGLQEMDNILNITPSERQALFSLAKPDVAIQEDVHAKYANPGQTKPHVIARQARLLSEDQLPTILDNKLVDPTERKNYERLRIFLLERA